MVDFPKLRVLVIDDVSTVRLVITKSLKNLEITKITQSDNITDAWEKLFSEHENGSPFDILFCDWNMPGGDGIDLLKKIRCHENLTLRLTKFVMITGANDKVLEAMDEGANNIIHKPFSIETIKEKLELIF